MERLQDNNATVELEALYKTLPVEMSSEISLPDYRSEISRLLWVRPTVMPAVRFLRGGVMEFSGRICYQVLYAGPDGRLYAFEHEDGYAFSLPVDGQDITESAVEVTPDVVIGRVAAPRKMTVRCRAHARVRAYKEKNLGLSLSAREEADACLLGGVAECGKLRSATGEIFELTDELLVETAGNLRVISARGDVFMPEAVAGSGYVHCRGEAVVTLLCAAETEGEERVFSTARRVPFEEDLPLEGVTGDWAASGYATVGEIRVDVEDGKVLLSLDITPTVQATCQQPIYYVKDVLLPGHVTVGRRTEEQLWVPTACGNRNFSLALNGKTKELGMPTGAQIVDAFADASIRQTQQEARGTALSGELCAHVLYRLGEEYGTFDAVMPFRVVTDGEVGVRDVCCRVPLLRVRAENDTLYADAEMALAVCAAREESCAPICEVRFEPQKEEKRGDVELYYPTKGETLWQVGKRYARSPEELAKINGLSPDALDDADVLSGVRYLLVSL